MMKAKNLNPYLIKKSAILKNFVLYYIYSILVIQLLFVPILWFCNVKIISIMDGIGFIIHLLFLIYFYNYSFTIIKLFINLYLIFISIFITIQIVILWKINPIIFAWYLLFPLGILNIFSYKTVIYWSIYIIILAITAFVIPVDQLYSVQVDASHIPYLNACTFICIFYLLFFIIYYNEKISKAENNIIITEHQNTGSALINEALPNEENEENENQKYNDLFVEIISFFDVNSPFKDADFSIQQLANELNSNSTYISRAINLNTGMNFKTFVNKYRINQIKEELNDIENNKYTLMYIYTNAGFKYQSTFNKVFKQIENITPSEYIAKQNIRKQ